MSILVSAFILGLLGSLHCVGMCGPLLMALPIQNESRFRGIFIYHLGRIFCYGLMGLLMSLLGFSLQAAGVHEKISLITGIALLFGLALFYSGILKSQKFSGASFVAEKMKYFWRRFFQTKSLINLIFIGFLNGLLPCGFVYVALGFSLAMTESYYSFLYMICFGLGTLPLLLGVNIFSKALHLRLRQYVIYLVPCGTFLAAVLLILRGLSLNIPYLSPLLANGSCCH